MGARDHPTPPPPSLASLKIYTEKRGKRSMSGLSPPYIKYNIQFNFKIGYQTKHKSLYVLIFHSLPFVAD